MGLNPVKEWIAMLYIVLHTDNIIVFSFTHSSGSPQTHAVGTGMVAECWTQPYANQMSIRWGRGRV